jgi:chromate transporter
VSAAALPVTFREALGVWLRVGLQSFGGPAGQIAVMHRILVDEKRWVSERRFLHALNYCMLLPGPEAQQLATYLGWLLHGTKGALAAGCLFVLPGCLAILALSYLYAAFEGRGVVAALLFGLKAAVLAIVVEALIRIGRRVLKNRVLVALAGLAFVSLFVFAVPFPLVVLGAAVVGLVGGRLRPETFAVLGTQEASTGGEARIDELLDQGASRIRPSLARALRVLAAGSALWLGPIALLALLLGTRHVFVLEALFFSKAAVVTFGGAYAVLAYIAQQAVERYGWLRPDEMLDGLGMAETTPGPLIMVVQFVGFLGAYRNPGALDPFVAGTLGALLTTWVTFVPCFLWILLGAPYVERLRGHLGLSAALSAITAAVVGVILNLAAWFALHVLFGELHEASGPLGLRLLVPRWSSLDLAAACISAAALVALLRYRVGILPLLAASVIAGIACSLALG